MRVSATSYAVLAEINHLEQEKVDGLLSATHSDILLDGDYPQHNVVLSHKTRRVVPKDSRGICRNVP